MSSSISEEIRARVTEEASDRSHQQVQKGLISRQQPSFQTRTNCQAAKTLLSLKRLLRTNFAPQ